MTPASRQTSVKKIGIVSNLNYVKSHVRALRKDGFDVVELGASPQSIPPSVDLVVVRTEACSHRGSETAWSWTRATGKPLVVENGISGIRRELKKLLLYPDLDEAVARFSRALQVLRRDRPEDNEEQIRATLSEMGATPPVIEQVLGGTVPEPTPAPKPTSVLPGPYPSESAWAKAVPEKRLRNEVGAAIEIMEQLPASVEATIRDTFMLRFRSGAGDWFPPAEVLRSKDWKLIRELKGRPTRFFYVLLRCLPADQTYLRTQLQDAYFEFTRKKTDGRIVEALGWATGRTVERPGRGRSTRFPEKLEDADVTPPADTLDEVHLSYANEEDSSNTLLRAGSEDEPAPAPKAEGLAGEPESRFWDEMGSVVAPLRTEMEERFASLRDEMENHLLDLMSQVADLRKQVTSLEEENREMRSALDRRPSEPGKTDSLLETIDALRSRGAKITLKFDPEDD
jgi:hypothetical protein